MEWFELVSTYVPNDPQTLTAYDSFRLWADHNRTYITFLLLVAVYYMGFATRIRMPILKAVLLYVVLFIGAIIFSILDVRLPIKSALFVAIVILLLVKMRIKPEQGRK